MRGRIHAFLVPHSRLQQLLLLWIAILGCVIRDNNQCCDGLSSNGNNGPTTTTTPFIITHRASAIFALMESTKKKNAFAIRVLEQDPSYLGLDRRDRAFARLLLSTAERRSGQIDRVVQKFRRNDNDKDDTKKKKKKNARPRLSDLLVDAALRIGAAQMLFMDVPKYAAVSETVESLRMHPKIKVSKAQISFVNAVLRNIDRGGGPALLEATSIIDNVDPWLANQWIQQYGRDTTETIVETAMAQSPVFVTVNQITTSGDVDVSTDVNERELERLEQIKDVFATTDEEGNLLAAELLPVGSIRIPDALGGAVSRWPLYDEGAWWVQDVAATLPAIALRNGIGMSLSGARSGAEDDSLSSSLLSLLKDLNVVDLCSAPGGKTAQLCSMGFGRVDAVEFSAKRSRSLLQNMERLGMEDRCNVVVEDGREYKPDTPSGKVNGVLVDAPCSASGVGSRRPDVLRKSIDTEELTTIQRELLLHSSNNLLEVGGVLVYATCSLLKQEGEHQIEWLLSDEGAGASGTQLETIPFAPGEIPGFDECIDENGWLRVVPGVLPGSLKFCDGFFVARLAKR